MELTKAQIRIKIGQLTARKRKYEQEKEKYETSLHYAKKLASNFNSGDKYLMYSRDNLKKYFTINNRTADKGQIEKLKSEVYLLTKKLNRTMENINSNIINIKSKIYDIDVELNKLKRQYNLL